MEKLSRTDNTLKVSGDFILCGRHEIMNGSSGGHCKRLTTEFRGWGTASCLTSHTTAPGSTP